MKKFLEIGAGVLLRFYQRKIMKVFDNGIRYIVLCWPRRLGKSLFAWRLIIREAINTPGVYWYCFNNYSTAHNDIWIAMTSKGVRFLDMIPEDMVVRMNASKLEIELKNGSIIKLIGIDKADKLVGTGLMGVVFDEYAVLNPTSIEFITAMLAETGGWRLMISTPRGKNHFYEEYQFAKSHPAFAYADKLDYGDSVLAGFLAKGFLEMERLKIISKYGNDALYQQEYMTSWISPNSGSVFGELTKIMRDEGRVTTLVPNLEQVFYAGWDIGQADHTSIVLFQMNEYGSLNVVDFIENRNVDVSWYVGEMEERGWNVHTHFLPHDAKHRKGARNETYKQVLANEHDIRNTVVLNKPNRVEDRLNHLRRIFANMQVDESNTRLLECLEKLEYEWNETHHIWGNKPTHKGGYSDAVDALTACAQAINKYNLSMGNVFNFARVRGAEPAVATKEARQERFSKFLEEQLALGGKKKKVNGSSLSTFI